MKKHRQLEDIGRTLNVWMFTIGGVRYHYRYAACKETIEKMIRCYDVEMPDDIERSPKGSYNWFVDHFEMKRWYNGECIKAYRMKTSENIQKPYGTRTVQYEAQKKRVSIDSKVANVAAKKVQIIKPTTAKKADMAETNVIDLVLAKTLYQNKRKKPKIAEGQMALSF
jgi:hypothetical protein